MKGDAISREERAQTAQKLARLTGLSAKFIDESNLRVPIFRFTKELLRDERRTVGRYDSRLEGIDLDPTSAVARLRSRATPACTRPSPRPGTSMCAPS